MKEILSYILFIFCLPIVSFILFQFLLRRPSLIHSDSVSIPTFTTFGSFSLQGLRPTNEDAHITQKLSNSLVSGVFDGHAGGAASKFCKRNIIQELTDDRWPLRLDSRFLADAGVRGLVDGTTACVVKLSRGQARTWNIGDSRAVLARNGAPVDLSHDFKPEGELERIYAAGGVVQPLSQIIGQLIIQTGPKRIYPGGLSVSRGIGDINFKNEAYLQKLGVSAPLVSSYPEISLTTLQPTDHFIIIACDGFWDVFTSQQATNLTYVLICLLYSKQNFAKSLLLPLGITQDVRRKQNSAQICSQLLAQFAVKQGSTDNVSVVLNIFEEQLDFDVEKCVNEMEFGSGKVIECEDMIQQFEYVKGVVQRGVQESLVGDDSGVQFWRLEDDPSYCVDEIDAKRKQIWQEYIDKGLKMSNLRNTPELTGFQRCDQEILYEVVDDEFLI